MINLTLFDTFLMWQSLLQFYMVPFKQYFVDQNILNTKISPYQIFCFLFIWCNTGILVNRHFRHCRINVNSSSKWNTEAKLLFSFWIYWEYGGYFSSHSAHERQLLSILWHTPTYNTQYRDKLKKHSEYSKWRVGIVKKVVNFNSKIYLKISSTYD